MKNNFKKMNSIVNLPALLVDTVRLHILQSRICKGKKKMKREMKPKKKKE